MNLNLLKGILIVFVIFDHNEYARSVVPAFLKGMSFHVIAFLTIPFLRKSMPLRSPDFAAYLFRLYYPFFLLTLALGTFVAITSEKPFQEHAKVVLFALYNGQAQTLDAATSMGLLWFLPSLISITVVRAVIEQGTLLFARSAIASLAVLHFYIGLIGLQYQHYFPMGLLPALYVLPLAYLGVTLQRRAFDQLKVGTALLATGICYAAAKAVQMHLNLSYEVGFMLIGDATKPLALIVNDAEGVFGTLFLFQVARTAQRWFALFESSGRYSMQVYLGHAFVALVAYRLSGLLPLSIGVELRLIITVFATAAISTLLAHLVMSQTFSRRLLFPKRVSDLDPRARRFQSPSSGPSHL